jgi:transposase-like protein
MSKIPQREWNAISARYAQGESISAIARTYGCTPPAIHYILKKSRCRAAPQLDQPIQQPWEAPSRPVIQTAKQQEPGLPPRAMEPHRIAQPPTRLSQPESPPPMGQASAAGGTRREHHLSIVAPARSGQQSPMVPQQSPRAVGRAAGSEGLDSELHDRAEAAIEAFRICFDAALAEGSPHERARLREAASNLMRVAARTTIVLDRLNALSERPGRDRGSDNGHRI